MCGGDCMWWISPEKYRILLLERKEYIGKSRVEAFSAFASGILAAVGAVTCDYSMLGGLWAVAVKALYILTALILTIYGGVMMIKALRSHYTSDTLYDETKALDEIYHRHSIVAIKDSFSEFPARFLVYHDTRWNCEFFPNFSTTDDDIKNIRAKLSGALKIPADEIILEKYGEDIHRKFSVSHDEYRTYAHTIYSAVIPFTPELRKDFFDIDGVRWHWMSLGAMKNDPHIWEINSDVISAVGKYIP